MTTITVSMDGKPAFNWEGDEAAVQNILADFPDGARHEGMTPEVLADNCVIHFTKLLKETTSDVGSTMAMMGVLWRILEAETGNADHPGKIGEYASAVDFDVDIRHGDKSYTIAVIAKPRFDA